jgi:hypothetical protein
MGNAERCQRYPQRRKAGVPTVKVTGGLNRFDAALRVTLPPVRPEPPPWFRGKRTLEIRLGRVTTYA